MHSRRADGSSLDPSNTRGLQSMTMDGDLPSLLINAAADGAIFVAHCAVGSATMLLLVS